MLQLINRLQRGALLRGFLIYFSTSVLNKGIPFLLLPVLTAFLSPAQYGLLAIFQMLVAFLVPLVSMNMPLNVTRNYYSKPKHELGLLIYNMYVILVGTSVLSFLGFAIYSSFSKELFGIPKWWLLALPLIALMHSSNELNQTLFRNQKKAFTFGVYEIARTFIDIGVTILLVVGLRIGWQGRAGGILLSSLVLGIVALSRLWQNGYMIPRIEWSKILGLLRISLPLLPHALGNAIIMLSDRIFISRMVGPEAVGVYSVGYQFGMLMMLLVMAFNRSWSPWLYERLANLSQSVSRRIVRATYLYFAAVLLAAGAITALSMVLLPLMTSPSFHPGIQFVGWVAYAYAIQGMYTVVFPYQVHAGRTQVIGMTTVVAALLNLVLNYVLIAANGTVGAAQATLLSYAAMFLIVWWNSNRVHPMPWLGALR